MGKSRTTAPTMVETVDEEGKVTQHRTKNGVEDAIHNNIGFIVSRVGIVEICNCPLS
jgi:hypothetical protein